MDPPSLPCKKEGGTIYVVLVAAAAVVVSGGGRYHWGGFTSPVGSRLAQHQHHWSKLSNQTKIVNAYSKSLFQYQNTVEFFFF
jgi:hypothetical protein